MIDVAINRELIIVGAGPAGLTAGIHAIRKLLDALVFEAKIPGGQTAEAALVENYPGFPDGIMGIELMKKMTEQAQKMDVPIHTLEEVTELDLESDRKIVKTVKNNYTADAVILATGCRPRKLGVRGERKFLGKGISYCATCDGYFFKDLTVTVVGSGILAVKGALYLSELASEVKLIHKRGELLGEQIMLDRLAHSKVERFPLHVASEIIGKDVVTGIRIVNVDTNEEKSVKTDGVFVLIGNIPNTDFAKRAGVKCDKHGYIEVNPFTMKTNVPGVFAAGDVTQTPIKQVTVAVGQGAIAALSAYNYIRYKIL